MKKLFAILLALSMSVSAFTYCAYGADGDEETDIEDNLTEDTLEDLNKGQEGFDQNAVQTNRDEAVDSTIENGEYLPTDLTLDDIKNIFGPSLDTVDNTSLDPIQIYIDGTQVSFPDTKPQLVDDRTLVPVRIVAEQLGAEVDWNEEQQMVTITKDSLTIILTIDNSTVYVNGAPQVLDVPAMVISDRTMVPFRFIFETFNMRVEWSEENRNGTTVSIIEAFSN